MTRWVYLRDPFARNTSPLKRGCYTYSALHIPDFMHGNEKMIWKEKKSRIRAVQMDYLRGLLNIRRMDKVPNSRLRELCGASKEVDEKIDKGVLHWFDHVGVCREVCRYSSDLLT